MVETQVTIDNEALLKGALDRIAHELGVPDDDYPAPVANAAYIADAALHGHRFAEGDEKHASWN